MFVDCRKLQNEDILYTKICIIGGGPAGIALAREFKNQNTPVAVIESGGLKPDAVAAQLGEGETEGDPFAALRDMRHRQYGGMSNRWNVQMHLGRIGVRYMPADRIDFERRDWVPDSGWPISYDHLIPFYERASQFCQSGTMDYEATSWETPDARIIKFPSGNVNTRVFKFGPSDVYTKEYTDDLRDSSHTSVYIYGSAAELIPDESGKNIKELRVASISGNKFTMRASLFILAAGGLDNPRIMLMSNSVQPAGVGNQHDVVGRYFMDHPLVTTGQLFPPNKEVIKKLFLYDKRGIRGNTIMGKFELSEEVMRRERLLNMSAVVFPRTDLHRSPGRMSIDELRHNLGGNAEPGKLLKHIKNIVRDTPNIVGNWYRHSYKADIMKPNFAVGEWSLEQDLSKYTKFQILSQTEQAPHRDNRVVLSRNLDILGYPMAKLINHRRDIEKQSVRRSIEIFADAFREAGMGDLKTETFFGEPILQLSTHHNMGTTRMNEDPKKGVVDLDCKVHGLQNLYIAGSSVFPVGGYANPTLTIIALAMRLADHIKLKHLKASEKLVAVAINRSPEP
ncbi:MAG: GMC family oxidoreductase [Chryseolinea sp.]